ncbi:MAG: M48 family metallopeptidase [Chitinophagaceae bacterium]|nr:M48 family metallopeptidase [Chitinophagaceae bacterium]
MKNLPSHYPLGPAGVPAAALQPSASFKAQVWKVLFSIFFFLLSYLLLIAAALLLALFCGWLGIMVMGAVGSSLGLVLGIGLIGLGAMTVWFLLKFLFTVSRVDTADAIELTAQTQPELFSFIRRLADETGTRFPKKILATPEVNASVFYNSSFWSMFLPVRKNLNIGLGLVNVLNVAEFKAVMAHEFGHFSQSSMKLGSFVYQLNRIIYNLLYDNDGYAKLLQGFANISGIFWVFARLNVLIIEQVQALLKLLYAMVNKQYMGLSRQMEFHADAVAASVAGSNHLISALHRIEMGSATYNQVLQMYNEWIPSSKKALNAYPDHIYCHLQMAGKLQMPLGKDGLPVVRHQSKTQHSSRIVYNDQWASHPDLADREAHLQQLNWTAPDAPAPAWTLFRNAIELQQEATDKLYRQVQWEGAVQNTHIEQFIETLQSQRKQYELPAVYGGRYDGRFISAFETRLTLSNMARLEPGQLTALLSEDQTNKPKRYQQNEQDLAILQAIAQRQIDTKSFDFDGVKHKAAEAAAVHEKLATENKQLLNEVNLADQQLFALAAKKSGQPDEVAEAYERFFSLSAGCDAFATTAQTVYQRFDTLLAGQQMSVEAAQDMVNAFKQKELPQLHSALRQLLAQALLNKSGTKVLSFLDKEYAYFLGDSFADQELRELFDVLQEVQAELTTLRFEQYKALLQQQVGWLGLAA